MREAFPSLKFSHHPAAEAVASRDTTSEAGAIIASEAATLVGVAVGSGLLLSEGIGFDTLQNLPDNLSDSAPETALAFGAVSAAAYLLRRPIARWRRNANLSKAAKTEEDLATHVNTGGLVRDSMLPTPLDRTKLPKRPKTSPGTNPTTPGSPPRLKPTKPVSARKMRKAERQREKKIAAKSTQWSLERFNTGHEYDHRTGQYTTGGQLMSRQRNDMGSDAYLQRIEREGGYTRGARKSHKKRKGIYDKAERQVSTVDRKLENHASGEDFHSWRLRHRRDRRLRAADRWDERLH